MSGDETTPTTPFELRENAWESWPNRAQLAFPYSQEGLAPNISASDGKLVDNSNGVAASVGGATNESIKLAYPRGHRSVPGKRRQT